MNIGSDHGRLGLILNILALNFCLVDFEKFRTLFLCFLVLTKYCIDVKLFEELVVTNARINELRTSFSPKVKSRFFILRLLLVIDRSQTLLCSLLKHLDLAFKFHA